MTPVEDNRSRRRTALDRAVRTQTSRKRSERGFGSEVQGRMPQMARVGQNLCECFMRVFRTSESADSSPLLREPPPGVAARQEPKPDEQIPSNLLKRRVLGKLRKLWLARWAACCADAAELLRTETATPADARRELQPERCERPKSTRCKAQNPVVFRFAGTGRGNTQSQEGQRPEEGNGRATGLEPTTRPTRSDRAVRARRWRTKILVGARGFEPRTSCAQGGCRNAI